MNQQDQPNIERQLAEYLDGVMSDAERERFEALLPNHPELLVHLEAQAQIDASLRCQFNIHAPSEAHVIAIVRSAESQPSDDRVMQPVSQVTTIPTNSRRRPGPTRSSTVVPSNDCNSARVNPTPRYSHATHFHPTFS